MKFYRVLIKIRFITKVIYYCIFIFCTHSILGQYVPGVLFSTQAEGMIKCQTWADKCVGFCFVLRCKGSPYTLNHLRRRCDSLCSSSPQLVLLASLYISLNDSTVLFRCVTIQTRWPRIGNSGVPRNFFRGGGSTNSVEDREKGDLGVVSP